MTDSPLQVASPSDLRDLLQCMVERELIGPAGGPEEEVLEGSVRERYLTGMLAPQRCRVGAEEIEELSLGGEDNAEEGKTEPGIAQPDSLLPSSLGMTFCVAAEAGALQIAARWGRYEKKESDTETTPTGQAKRVWKRRLIEGKSAPLALLDGTAKLEWQVTPEFSLVKVVGVIRKNSGGDRMVTLFLVNGQTEKDKNKDEAWLFQPELSVEAPDGKPIFVRRHLAHDAAKSDPVTLAEEQTMNMLYRHIAEFAVGHGIAVHAHEAPDDPRRAVRISTRSIPTYEVPVQTPPSQEEIPALAGLVLDMKVLGEMPAAQLPERLKALPTAYAAWIEGQRQQCENDPELRPFVEQAKKAVAGCTAVLARIREGIELLERDPKAARAFQFANRAMALQRVRTIYTEQVRRGLKPDLAKLDVPVNRTWYPFQLAFMLLNLPGITDLKHPDRTEPLNATADLLWFPTGGGKTEAYLGLTAYTLGIRRLQGDIEGRPGQYGVAVLMRYTLRLLTLQQFQRAAALICACEYLRQEALAKKDPSWGVVPFRIGLWVGQKTTPNTTEQSHDAVQRDRGHGNRATGAAGSGSPAQLKHCPWCGCEIGPGRDIVVETQSRGRGRTFQFCGDPLGNCPFSRRSSPDEGIPLLLVDDEIYRMLPALLIATVDKFAQMPWRGQVQMLFGRVNGFCPRHGFRSPEIEDTNSHPKKGSFPAATTVQHGPLRPPDLIIQDELHLISGPLGTLVGLYETAVDELASWTVGGARVRPKVIASTATIRRAPEQIKKLFLRQAQVFPPHGTDVRDNFFSVQRAPSAEFPGRRYLGICAPGRRIKAATVQLYVAILAAAQTQYEKYGSLTDPWMTLLAYFNSMRELGGTRRLVDDRVRSALRDMDKRGLSRRKKPFVEELTSRMSGTDIPRILDRLEVVFDPQADNGPGSEMPIDVLLATNMVSVGVDVKRLGLMVVNGQPKTTAEYIQATSRVGRNRKSPGLVFTLFNWARPRDLSHYERFEHYHGTFYQHVEALSVTPFAARALDRGLSAVMTALIRLADEKYNKNGSAADMKRTDELVLRALEVIRHRAEAVEGKTVIGENIAAALNSRLDYWLAQAQKATGGKILGYRDEKDGVTKGLLQKPGLEPWDLFTCLMSLREVEPSVGLILQDGGLDEVGVGHTDSPAV